MVCFLNFVEEDESGMVCMKICMCSCICFSLESNILWHRTVAASTVFILLSGRGISNAPFFLPFGPLCGGEGKEMYFFRRLAVGSG